MQYNSSSQLIEIGERWMRSKGWKVYNFQKKTWLAYFNQKSGLLNAPTGSGKTYALWIPATLEFLDKQDCKGENPSVRILWITPLRALAKDIQRTMQLFCDEIGIGWQVGLRTGDISSTKRKNQKKSPPPALVITPESLHVLFKSK